MTDARDVTATLGGRWHGTYGAAPCPVCQPERRRDQNALTLTDGRDGQLLAHCKKAGCPYQDILKAAGLQPGAHSAPDPSALARRDAERRAADARRAEQARRLWRESLPIAGTVAESYLRGRRITCPLPPTLRFHPDCWHGPTARRGPALVAAVQGSGSVAVHRTWLRPDGSGKADIEPAKAMLGRTQGGAVRLCVGHARLVVAEGIESGLSLLCGLLPGPATLWAALSTSGMRSLRLPASPGRLTVACDGDRPGREAARALAHRARGLGWQVRLLDPGDGRDFNDILTMKEGAE